MEKIKVAFASDHAGYGLKKILMAKLSSEGFQQFDFGCYSEQSADYPDFAHPLAVAVENNEYQLGITLCGSGNGINITANKHQGIRSALCWTKEIAELARQHNDANVCAIPARFVSEELATEIMFAFLNTAFEGGRHLTRINKIPVK